MIMIISSLENSRVKSWTKLKQKKYRDDTGLFVVEERHLIEEAIRSSSLETLIVREGCLNPFDREAVFVSAAVMKKLSNNVSLNDCIAICRINRASAIRGSSFIILEQVQDAGNVGTIIRTACSLGYDAVLLSKGCADPYSYKSIQASQGAFFHIPVIIADLADLIAAVRQQGCKVYATTLDSDKLLSNSPKTASHALLFGNEGQGLSREAIELSDEKIRIEMESFESLNVAIAMGICAYVFKYGRL